MRCSFLGLLPIAWTVLLIHIRVWPSLQVQRGPLRSLFILVVVNSKGLWGGCPIVRASDEHCFIGRVLRAQRLYSRPPVFLFHFNLACRDLTGGADLGACPPAAGSLRRAGCEDGRAGQQHDPFISFPPSLTLGQCSILGLGLGGSRSVIRASLGDRSC